MNINTFRQLENELIKTLNSEDYQIGLNIIKDNIVDFEDHAVSLQLWQAKLLVKNNNNDDAIKVLAEALANGYWISKSILLKTDSFQPLQEIKEFQNMVEISAKMEEVETSKFLPQMVIRPKNGCGPQDAGCPLFYFLHDDDDQALSHLPYWHSLSNQGYIVGMPQPNNAVWVGGYRWQNEAEAKSELLRNITNLHLRYSVDVERVIMGGYGKGGELAFDLFLNGDIIGNSFVLVNPTDSLVAEDFESKISASSARNKKCIIIANKENKDKTHKLNRLVELLNKNYIDSQLKIMEFSTNKYPESFSEEIPKIISFLHNN